MPRLREMLGQEGLQLAHSEVADHSATRDNDRNLNPENLTQDTADLEEEIDDFFPRSVNVTADTMVDYYV
jgi:flagellar hook-length control protein FliK